MTHVLDPGALTAEPPPGIRPLAPYSDAVASDAAFRAFLHGLPGVDQVGAEARTATLGTRSVKTTSEAWAIDTAIGMGDLTTLEGADTVRPDVALRRLQAVRLLPGGRPARC